HGASNPLLRYIQEWQSPNFHDPINLIFALSLLLLAVTGIASRVPSTEYRVPSTEGTGSLGTRYSVLGTRIDVTDALILALFTIMALQVTRLLPLYGVMVLPLLGGGLARTWPALSSRSEAPSPAVEGR